MAVRAVPAPRAYRLGEHRRHGIRLNTSESPPCPRQESNLDLPLRRTRRGLVGIGRFLGRYRGFGRFGRLRMRADLVRFGRVWAAGSGCCPNACELEMELGGTCLS